MNAYHKKYKPVKEEKARIISDFERRFIGGMTTEEEFKKQTGINPTEEMKKLRANVSQTPRKYIMSILKDIKKREDDKGSNI